MKKNIFTILSGLAFLFLSCQNSLISEEEKVEFILPVWEELLPKLSRWKISAASADFEKDFFLDGGEKAFLFTVNRNEPFCLTAGPLTLLSDGSEVNFFKPAGALYPYFAEGDASSLHCVLTWEAGFTAEAMQKIISSKKETGLSSDAVKTFLMQFNWKKLQEKINQNIAASILSFESDSKTKFYNPWQLDSFTLLDNLSFAIFDSKYLNNSYIFTVELELLRIPQDKTLLSSFLPENQILQKYRYLTLKKKTPQIYMMDNTYALTLSASSAKKVSADLTYMPILIEDYEHSD